ncbi:MAG: hypothetical protein JJT94_06525 [Bernardetiaceae bacterium]|nr:hypothetical protein [Bernardetiaceae bacterium]
MFTNLQTYINKFLVFLLLILLIAMSSCHKRSTCPHYRDSDPAVLFGDGKKSMDQTLKEQEATYKSRKKQRVKGLGKKPKRKKKRRR